MYHISKVHFLQVVILQTKVQQNAEDILVAD